MSTKKENAVFNYFREAFQELRKVTWPTKDQAVKATLIVLGFCLGVAIYIGVLDGVFNWAYNLFIDFAQSR